jgi:oligopeptide/dipeptide ABC transporter ATP-binding protein
MGLRRQMQMVFQDPYSSLNSRMTIAASIQEPALVHKVGDERSRLSRAGELLELVGLRSSDLKKYPHQFSGGQRQRICIARALMLDTKVLVLDEPVSALDVSTQAQVVNLLTKLQAELGLAYLFVSHDLSVVRHMADQILVMYLGRAVETGPSETIFRQASHPYTASLLSAVPAENPRKRATRQRIILSGELPDPSNPPAGCCFNTRCWKATDLCVTDRPGLTYSTANDAQFAACHFPLEPSPTEPALSPTR